MKVKNFAIIFSILILFDLGITVSYGFLSSSKVLKNIFVIGENKTSIKEEFKEPPPININKVNQITKKVQIINSDVNEVSSYVRVKLIYSNLKYKDNIILMNLDSINWFYNKGWYYYKKPLKPGEATTYLFKGLKFEGITEENYDKNFRLSVYEESIEAKDKEIVEAFQNYKNGGVL